MMRKPLSSFFSEVSDRLFVTDKDARTVFFPWGSNKQGYLIENDNLVAKTKKHYQNTFFISLSLWILGVPFINKFWIFVTWLAIYYGGWYLYISSIVKSLQPAKSNYSELILATYELDDSESEDVERQTDLGIEAEP